MKKQKGFTLPELLLVIGFTIVGLATLAGTGCLAYVLYHFITKFW